LKKLLDIRDNNKPLSPCSLELLTFSSTVDHINYIEKNKNFIFSQPSLVTCMEVLSKDTDDSNGNAVSLLVVGTETCQIFILPPDPSMSQYLCKIDIQSPPVLMTVYGAYDVEWRISVTARDGHVYYIKSGDVRGTAVLSGSTNDLGSLPVSLAKQDKNIWVATMDKALSCLNFRGKKLRTIQLTEDIVEICAIEVKRTKLNNLLVVGLISGEMRLYRDSTLLHRFYVDPPIIAVQFGSYGREENSLIVIHGNGNLLVQYWRRLTNFEDVQSNGPPTEQVDYCTEIL
jgi:Bardet-Biedl syndrome 1 protein